MEPPLARPTTTRVTEQLLIHTLHSVPSYKERSYKERLVEMLQSKEQRLVEILALKEHRPLFNCKKFFA